MTLSTLSLGATLESSSFDLRRMGILTAEKGIVFVPLGDSQQPAEVVPRHFALRKRTSGHPLLTNGSRLDTLSPIMNIFKKNKRLTDFSAAAG